MQATHCSRKFAWVSSSNGDPETLENLAMRMARFYADLEERSLYQFMLETTDSSDTDETSVRVLLPRYIKDLAPETVLEVGCADARLYQRLLRLGYAGAYSGVDVPPAVIERNRQAYPEARWETASAYSLPFADATFDVCFSLFVLEHLVYPERGLEEFIRVLKPSGKLALVFPDFVVKRQMNSQLLGLSPLERATDKLRSGRFFDALLSLYDSRVRLPKALRDATRRVGPFPVNAEPICLTHRNIMRPDIDAIYIASKEEVSHWARSRGHVVEFPCGTDDGLADTPFMSITKASAIG